METYKQHVNRSFIKMSLHLILFPVQDIDSTLFSNQTNTERYKENNKKEKKKKKHKLKGSNVGQKNKLTI